MKSRIGQRYLVLAAAILALSGAAAAIWGVTQFTSRQLVQYATFVAGIAGPLWTAATVAILYVAYLAQREQLDHQQREIEANAAQLASQNFDRLMFSLLDMRMRILEGIQIRKSDPHFTFSQREEKVDTYDLFGRAAVNYLLHNLWETFEEAEARRIPLDRDGNSASAQLASLKHAYAKYHRDWREFLPPLHANAILLLRLISAAPKDQISLYMSILRAHISPDEVALLAYHCWLYEGGTEMEAGRHLVAQLFFPGSGVPVLNEHRENIFAAFATHDGKTA